MKDVIINELQRLDADNWLASGIIYCSIKEVELPFSAKTILYKGQPIFKVVEDGKAAVKLSQSAFTRGMRQSIARECKAQMLAWKSPQLRLFNDDGSISDDVLKAQEHARCSAPFGTSIQDLVIKS